MSLFAAKTPSGKAIEVAVEAGRVASIRPIPDSCHSLPYVIPGFVDAHCHVLPMGLDMLKPSLFGIDTHDGVLDVVATSHREMPAGEWLHIVQYDQNRFTGGHHLVREQLDRVTGDRPTLIRHSNGHASIANSAALRRASVTDDVIDPEGGTFRRDASGRPDGVLFERAHEVVTSAAPPPSPDQMVEAIRRAAVDMLARGITCASDMMTGRWDVEMEVRAYSMVASLQRRRLYVQWGKVFGPRGLGAERLQEIARGVDPNFCRIAGIKIFADGAIASATAAIHGEYVSGGNGQLIYEPSRLTSMVEVATRAGWPVSVHAIGDRAVDHVLDAFESSGEPSRHRLEHAMILSDEQIERIARCGCEVTVQPEFLVRFGQAYEAQLGIDRASRLKRLASLHRAGVPLSISSDRPIVSGDPWVGITAAVHRPAGFDSAENVSMELAIALATEGGARANGDGATMAHLEVGAHADFQLYDGNLAGTPSRVMLAGELVTGAGEAF